jgi:aconitate hydratase
MANPIPDCRSQITCRGKRYQIYNPRQLDKAGYAKTAQLPYSMRVLLENLLRHQDDRVVTAEHVQAVAQWQKIPAQMEIPFQPARVILQDFTGVPCVADLAAMRSVVKKMGQDPSRINPIVPVDLVIDHSVQVDFFGTANAYELNVKKEFERNSERYRFLKWAQKSFQNFRVVPPGMGIVHQVNLEFLATLVQTGNGKDGLTAYPDTLVGTDSHTTMINGLGVMGWGVGGIEAEAVMLGQPYFMMIPQVIGVRLTGKLREGVVATDLVLLLTSMLREKGVVDKFVEFFGPGLANLTLPDRATVANMSPEYGATMGFFPVDDETLNYMKNTGRKDDLVELVAAYTKESGLFYDPKIDSVYSDILELDLGTVEAMLAGPSRPHDKIKLTQMKKQFASDMQKTFGRKVENDTVAKKSCQVTLADKSEELADGSVVIASITSCTNTSNPAVLLGAGILAKKAAAKGLKSKPCVKTSLAPGSRAAIAYLKRADLLRHLEALGFYTVGFGCTTCIGNSGPLPQPVSEAIKKEDLVVAAVLSGNRNFEARIQPQVKGNYLASPILVVAYAIAGRIDIDFASEPIGYDSKKSPVFLRDIWPSNQEIEAAIKSSVTTADFVQEYGKVFDGEEMWKALQVPQSQMYEWDAKSTYIQEPPFFQDFQLKPPATSDIRNARVLAILGDSITTDHISPAGSIDNQGPAGKYLIQLGVPQVEFNSYGARRGNHHVMERGTFGNVRIKNHMVPGVEGYVTVHFPSKQQMSIYDASVKYREAKVPLIVIAGKEYGSGSSRDWAAKGPYLLGVKAVIAQSFERIHRSNLIGMGILPLQFKDGDNAKKLGLDGSEEYTLESVADIKPRQTIQVTAKKTDGTIIKLAVTVRLDSGVEVGYFQNGGILPTVLRKMLS